MTNGPVQKSLQTPKESEEEECTSNIINHESVTKPSVKNFNFECDLCPTFFGIRNQLLSHYENVHDKKLKQFIDFKSHEEFSNWKDMLEKERGTFFRKDRIKKSSNMNTFYYVCHRSYKKQKVNESNRTKLTKSQGSKMSSKYCNAYLNVGKICIMMKFMLSIV